MTTFSDMAMYSLTVQPSGAAQRAITGDFIGRGTQQVAIASGSRLTLMEASRRHRTFREKYSQELFGIIRQIDCFRIAGSPKDHIVIGTDSGRLVTIEYLAEENRFAIVYTGTFGKSGIRRVVPGEYVAADPYGRAIFINSVEKNKLMYSISRKPGRADVELSSPLAADKANTIVFYMLALDDGLANPTFAALEMDYTDSENDPSGEAFQALQKELVFYEYDTGLNHVVRKFQERVDRTANILFRLPGGAEGPSGLFCCGVETISYHYINNAPANVLNIPIPRRRYATEDPNRKRIIVAGCVFPIRDTVESFYLLQTDDGDLFKISWELSQPLERKVDTGNSPLKRLRIEYFATIPVATNLLVLKSGFLYAACESGDQILYDFGSLGVDGAEVWTSDDYSPDWPASYKPIYFTPQKTNTLEPVETLSSMAPIMDMHVTNLTEEDAPQIYTVSGTGHQSTFRTSKHALEVLDLIESQLPQHATHVWTVKRTAADEYDAFIVLCFAHHTFVLEIGEDVEEAQNSGLLKETTSLGIQQWGEDCIIQIHPRGIRHIGPSEDEESAGPITDWPVPEHRTIVACASNNRQVAIALSSGEIMYFECDSDMSLAQADALASVESTITSLAIADVPEGRISFSFLAVGCGDSTVRIFNVVPNAEGEILQQLSVQALSAAPSSLAIQHMADRSSYGESLYLHVGLVSGVYIRTVMDEYTGELSETRRRFLGTIPIRFAKVTVNDKNAILAMSSRAWLGYPDPRNSTLALTPLNYEPFESAGSFRSEAFTGIICVRGEDLRIFTLHKLTNNVHQESIPLRYTPRKFTCSYEVGLFYVIESDANMLDGTTRNALLAEAGIDPNADVNGGKSATNGNANGEENEEADEEAEPPKTWDEMFGYPHVPNRWASCVQVVDPITEKKVIETQELASGQAALCVALVNFESYPNSSYLAVGCGNGMTFDGGFNYESGAVIIYQIIENGRRLEFVHSTKVRAPVHALMPFKGKLAVGVGPDLALYDMGTKSLLRKALQSNCTATRIVGLRTQGSRIIAADQSQSVTYVTHKELVHPERLLPFAGDSVARYTTCIDMLDYETTVGADKFGNIWAVRCPPKVSETADESIDGQHLIQDKGYLNAAPARVELAMHFFTNDIPMAVQKEHLITGGDKIIIWAGLQGTIGVFIPIASRKEMKMFQRLEQLIREEDKPISGRDHLAFRSYYNPVKNVIDGDLIERYLGLSNDARERLAGSIEGGWDASTIEQKIWNLRGLYAF